MMNRELNIGVMCPYSLRKGSIDAHVRLWDGFLRRLGQTQHNIYWMAFLQRTLVKQLRNNDYKYAKDHIKNWNLLLPEVTDNVNLHEREFNNIDLDVLLLYSTWTVAQSMWNSYIKDLLNHYAPRVQRIIFMDDDACSIFQPIYSVYRNHMLKLYPNYSDKIVITTHYPVRIYPNQYYIPFILDEDEYLDIKPLSLRDKLLVFIGNSLYKEILLDYISIIRSKYNNTDHRIDIYGSWSYLFFNPLLQNSANWFGPTNFTASELYNVQSTSRFALNIISNKHASIGFVVQRLAQYLASGTLALSVPFAGSNKFISDSYIIHDPSDLLSWVDRLYTMTDAEYTSHVICQRNKIINHIGADKLYNEVFLPLLEMRPVLTDSKRTGSYFNAVDIKSSSKFPNNYSYLESSV